MGIFVEGREPRIDENGYFYIGVYHPFRLRNYKGGKRLIRNPRFDPFSRMVLNLKSGYYSSVSHILGHLQSIINHDVVFTVSVIPAHDGRLSTSIRFIAQEIAKGSNCIDGTMCLQRFAQLSKMARGGRRGVERHLRTICVTDPDLIANRSVLLLDDVTTTGATFSACKQLLYEAGATNVICLAVGKTALDNPPHHSYLKQICLSGY